MKRAKPEESQGFAESMSGMAITDEERKQAMIGVITNVAAFAAVVLALRVGKHLPLEVS